MAKLGKIPTKRRGRTYKVTTVQELEQLFAEGDGIVLMNNKGLTVAEATELRSKMRENKVAVKIAKNTLIRIALKNAGYPTDDVDKILVGPTMVAVGMQDPVSPAKGAAEFIKNHGERLEIKGGLLEKKFLDVAKVQELATLPGREELISRMLGSMLAPAQNMAYALNACVSQFAWALSAHKAKLEEQEG
ncbi:MAG: large subunit ribosomal protein [Candidatus Sumerlaeota bacterium]|nr:large subunit ribosomal protein [Candidatus Sumerlaeota bacterium]